MAGAARQGDKLNVFISYSRDDLAFADQLRCGSCFGFGITIDRQASRPARTGRSASALSSATPILSFSCSPRHRLARRSAPGRSRKRSARQAHPSRDLSLARGREPAAATCRPQLHLLLRGAEISGLGFGTGLVGLVDGAQHRSRLAARAHALPAARDRVGCGRQALRAGFCPAPTSRWPRPGSRAGPRTRRSRPRCSSISSRRARTRTRASKAPRRSGCRRMADARTRGGGAEA